MEQFCSFFAVWVQIWPPYTLCKWKQIIEKSFWTGSFNFATGFEALNDSDILAPKVGYGKWSNFAPFSLFVSKFYHLM